MEEELKRLVAQAIARGATNEEIERIISEYGASKKKAQPLNRLLLRSQAILRVLR